MIELKKTKSKNKVTVNLMEVVSIEHAGEFKNTLIKAFQNYNEITVDLEKVTDMHIAALQIILSAQKEAEKTDKKFFLNGHLNKDFKNVLKGTGFAYYAGEDLQTETNSFWITGGK